jgi:hypothetical protein
LFFYWIGGTSTKLRDNSSSLNDLITIFKEADIEDDAEEIQKFVCEQWRFGWRLHNFCTKCLGESATVFFLPHLAAE